MAVFGATSPCARVSTGMTARHPTEPLGLVSSKVRKGATLAASRRLEHRQLGADSGRSLEFVVTERAGPARFVEKLSQRFVTATP
jgi:hypothetical protein